MWLNSMFSVGNSVVIDIDTTLKIGQNRRKGGPKLVTKARVID